jgi:hypothetical protein
MVGRSGRTTKNKSSDYSVASGLSGLWSFISTATFRRRRETESKRETNKKAGKRLKGKGYALLVNNNAATTSAGQLDDYLAVTKAAKSGPSEFRSSESAGNKSGERSRLSKDSLATRFYSSE